MSVGNRFGMMRRGALAAAAVMACGGCVSQKSDWASLVRQSSQPETLSRTQLETAGLTALGWGDNWTAIVFLERAALKRDVPLYRFNLATAYQRVGKLDEAAAIYSTLLQGPADPRFVVSDNIKDPLSANAAQKNLAQVARVRLDQIQASRPLASVNATNAAAAGKPISELLAAPTPTAVAHARDQAAGGGAPTT